MGLAKADPSGRRHESSHSALRWSIWIQASLSRYGLAFHWFPCQPDKQHWLPFPLGHAKWSSSHEFHKDDSSVDVANSEQGLHSARLGRSVPNLGSATLLFLLPAPATHSIWQLDGHCEKHTAWYISAVYRRYFSLVGPRHWRCKLSLRRRQHLWGWHRWLDLLESVHLEGRLRHFRNKTHKSLAKSAIRSEKRRFKWSRWKKNSIKEIVSKQIEFDRLAFHSTCARFLALMRSKDEPWSVISSLSNFPFVTIEHLTWT